MAPGGPGRSPAAPRGTAGAADAREAEGTAGSGCRPPAPRPVPTGDGLAPNPFPTPRNLYASTTAQRNGAAVSTGNTN